MIRVENLSKIYQTYAGPRSLFKELVLRRPTHHRIEALREINFAVPSGQSFGVIGDNGAGKSTLLKILSGTTLPSGGRVEVEGTVGALLELGTGFHPDFSGRENIRFSGALMGLSGRQIRQQESDIIAFAELEQFIDQPVKIYSSGMYLRLGFSVATAFDPAVLIIDEALAVGDQAFQKKCTDRILDFRRRGKTIFFCSHNLHQVKTLCQRALWLRRGKQAALGESSEVVAAYRDFSRFRVAESVFEPARSEEGQRQLCWVEDVKLLRPNRGAIATGETLALEVWARFLPEFKGEPGIGIGVVRNDGRPIYVTATAFDKVALSKIGPDRYYIRAVFPKLALLQGRYHFNVVTTDQDFMQSYDAVEGVEPFTVANREPERGAVRLEHYWESSPNGGDRGPE